jgi:hypothetical protein
VVRAWEGVGSLLLDCRERSREREGIEVLWRLAATDGYVKRKVVCEAETDPYQVRPRGIRMGLEILRDIPIVCPAVDKSKLE